MIGQVIQGELKEQLERHNSQERMLHEFIREEGLQAFPAVVVAPNVTDGIESLVMCVGLGELRPNTILLGWPREIERAADFGGILRTLDFMGRSILIARFNESKPETEEKESQWTTPEGTIDVWWRGKQNGELMLLLAHLLTLNAGWKNRTVRLLRVIDNEAGRDEVHKHLVQLAEKARIKPNAKWSFPTIIAMQFSKRQRMQRSYLWVLQYRKKEKKTSSSSVSNRLPVIYRESFSQTVTEVCA